VDGRDQGVPAGPFRWAEKPRVSLKEWVSETDEDYVHAVCEYRDIDHARRVLFLKPHLLIILDEVRTLEGEHTLEQFWHLGEPAVALSPRSFCIGDRAVLAVADCQAVELSEAGEHGWRSPALGVKLSAPVIRVSRRGTPPMLLAAVLSLEESPSALELDITYPTCLKIQGRYKLEISIPKRGRPTPVPA
jgi:hypothetical protein